MGGGRRGKDSCAKGPTTASRQPIRRRRLPSLVCINSQLPLGREADVSRQSLDSVCDDHTPKLPLSAKTAVHSIGFCVLGCEPLLRIALLGICMIISQTLVRNPGHRNPNQQHLSHGTTSTMGGRALATLQLFVASPSCQLI